MCEEVFEIVKNMDRKNVELQLCLQCAPTISRLKTSNLFSVPSEDELAVREVLRGSGILSYKLVNNRGRVVFLVFNRRMLSTYLNNEMIRLFFKELGYESCDFGHVLKNFQKRYDAYVNYGGEFPHEMGLLLGYPIEDVRGFIDNNGKNYLLSGYWKVYGDRTGAQSLFARYDQVKDEMILSMHRGDGFRDILKKFRQQIHVA